MKDPVEAEETNKAAAALVLSMASLEAKNYRYHSLV